MQDLNKIWSSCVETLEKNKIVDDKIILDSLFKPATLEEIEDNQELIMAIRDGAILNNLREFNINELKQNLEDALAEAFEDKQTEEISRVYNEIHKQIELL